MFSAGAFVLAARFLPQSLWADAAFRSQAETAAFASYVFLGIDPDGTVRIVTHRSEMGTGIRTRFRMIAADELDADWKRVKIEQAIGDARYGDQNTDGSQSIRDFFDGFVQAGAIGAPDARAGRGQRSGACRSPSAKPADTKSFTAQRPPARRTASSRRQPRSCPFRNRDAPASRRERDTATSARISRSTIWTTSCTGKAVFGMDAKVDGMVLCVDRASTGAWRQADVVRRQGGTARYAACSPRSSPLRSSLRTVFKPLGGVAVIANSTWAAFQGRKKLKIDWDLGPNA